MGKILISWIAYENDFIKGKGTVNSDGPSCTVHKYFYLDYEYHLLLTASKSTEEDTKFQYLLNHLRNNYNHRIEEKALDIRDIINVGEICGKINALLYSLNEYEIDIFISPGTPAMQVAWYFAHEKLKLETNLFQIRKAEQTLSKNKPQQVWVDLDQSKIPTALLIREYHKNKKSDEQFKITKSLEPIYKLAEKVAATDKITVLILGDTGTGKEGLAEFIHNNSPRSKGRFIPINCAAIGDSLLESRLFGFAKGAFTGADKDTAGLFENASGGTIFLDEIGDISSYMQQSLLRVLQEKQIYRIGESISRPINVRVIAATNKDLVKLCSESKFRWDLYYRLSVVELTLPSLLERGSKEMEEILNFILQKKSLEYKTTLLKISSVVKKKILAYPFPGNIRELENLIERLYSTIEGEVTEESLPKKITTIERENSLKLADVEKEHIKKVYEMYGKNAAKAAKILDISPGTMNTKLKLIYDSKK